MRILLILPGIVTPSLNETRKWIFKRETWKLSALKKTYLEALIYLCRADDEKFRAKPGEKRHIEFHSYRKRLIDHTNLVGGAKELEDSLKTIGLIHDDSPEFLTSEFYQYTVKTDFRTEIAIKTAE